ncbi:MAG: transporter [Actinomycetota bacterium]|nr:transporter [Actinomycetota bacterium]
MSLPMAAVKIGDSLQQGLDSFFGFVPNILGFLVILLIGWLIAKAVRAIVNRALDGVGVDRALHESSAGQYVERISPGAKPSHLIGATAYWFIFLFALSAAIGALKIPALTSFIAEVQAFLPNVIVAILIFVGAAALAGAVAGAVQKLMGDTPTGKLVTAVVPGLILAIGTFMMLNQLHIAEEIVTITYAALLGMLALAGALAFGLGGRDVAAQMLQGAYDAGQRNKGQMKADIQAGRDRAKEQAEQAKSQVGSNGGGSEYQSGPGASSFSNY